MGFLASSPPKPQMPPMPPPAANPPTQGSQQIALAGEAAKAKAAAAEGQGFDNTIKTSPEGLQTPPSTAHATLLGQAGV